MERQSEVRSRSPWKDCVSVGVVVEASLWMAAPVLHSAAAALDPAHPAPRSGKSGSFRTLSQRMPSPPGAETEPWKRKLPHGQQLTSHRHHQPWSPDQLDVGLRTPGRCHPAFPVRRFPHKHTCGVGFPRLGDVVPAWSAWTAARGLPPMAPDPPPLRARPPNPNPARRPRPGFARGAYGRSSRAGVSF